MRSWLAALALLLLLPLPLAAVPAPTSVSARPLLAGIFTEHMVLQRNRRDPVWGWAPPGASITLTLADRTVRTTAAADGAWHAALLPLPAGGPYALTVTDGLQKVTLHDVLIGDVWLCAGQSNMEMGIGNAVNGEQEIAAADFPQIRLFTVERRFATTPQTDIAGGRWSVCTPENIRSQGFWNGFSAAGYFFGREIHREIGVPIGLIQTAWSGTPAEAWTSESALHRQLPEFDPAVTDTKALAGDPTGGVALLNTWYQRNAPPDASGDWAAPDLDDSAWKTFSIPAYWEDSGLPEFAGFDGVAWFRRQVDLPPDITGKEAALRFKADDVDSTWVNGVPVGATADFSADRQYRIPAGVLRAGRNVITIRIIDIGGKGGLNVAPTLELAGAPARDLSGDWRYRIGFSLANATPLPSVLTYNQDAPTVSFNGVIYPIVPFALCGAVWYQGESNGDHGYQYRRLLPAMIADWRSRWGQGDFPFYIVQLPGYLAPPGVPGDHGWADLREAQLLTAEHVPNCGLAVAIDLGAADQLHPVNKQDIGHRLALVALAKTYGRKIEYSGPSYRSMAIEGSAIRLRFTHVGKGLVARGDAPLRQFAIAGADRKFVWADAHIDGDTVVVASQQVSNPVAVRYAWAINPAGCNLYNQAGLPGSPFRTDDWPVITQNVR